MMGFWDGSGISWTICKQSAACSTQITTPTPHHSIFTDRLLFLMPVQQCQSTEGTNNAVSKDMQVLKLCSGRIFHILAGGAC